MSRGKIHGIGTVVRRTELTSHVIRAWEKRYGAVDPDRSDGNQRLYSDDDITRLTLLKRATDGGMKISRAATLNDDSIRSFLRDERIAEPKIPQKLTTNTTERTQDDYVNDAFRLVRDVDQQGLYELLNEATFFFGLTVVLDEIVGRIMIGVGERWRNGDLRIFHEHLASAAVRSYLERVHNATPLPADRPVLISTTPAGQQHELGALLCAAVAKTERFRTVYLGANTPAEEIIRVAQNETARFLALSLYYPAKDLRVAEELRTIWSAVPSNTSILLGGYASGWYFEQLKQASGDGVSHGASTAHVSLISNARELRDVLLAG
jgi:DNA-binding transcriptional MerR regulator/methylmalonyl-CoA mutase cobalamin-binding subunit